jgi:hypothetical protein
VQLLNLLLHEFRAQVRHTGCVTARPGKVCDEPLDYGVGRGREHDRYRRRRGFCRERRRSAGCGDHRDLPAHQIGRQRRQPIIVTLCPAIFDRHVAAFDEARFAQALAERGDKRCVPARRFAAEEPHHGRLLLRTRSERPCCRGDTE